MYATVAVLVLVLLGGGSSEGKCFMERERKSSHTGGFCLKTNCIVGRWESETLD